MSTVLGWDVGGANVKAARVGNGECRLVERPFALWKEPERLPKELQDAARALGGARKMAVTMTAELADCFPTKRDGVHFVLDAFAEAFPGADASFFGVDGQFHSVSDARRRPLRIAAANWLASAMLAAESEPDAFVVDCGSTTTDIVPIVAGRVAAAGRNDPGRLRRGELVYTGALRTPVCAIVRSLPLGKKRCRVAAELFAIAADAHLWLGLIGEHAYTCDAPDGRGKTRALAGARLSRMICADAEMLGDDGIFAIANAVREAQVQQIASGIRQVQRRLGKSSPPCVLALGTGAFLVRDAARLAALPVRDFDVTRLVPAAAVASLLSRAVEA